MLEVETRCNILLQDIDKPGILWVVKISLARKTDNR